MRRARAEKLLREHAIALGRAAEEWMDKHDEMRAERDRLLRALVNAAVPLELLHGMRAIGIGPALQAEIDSAVLGIRAVLGEKEEHKDVRDG